MSTNKRKGGAEKERDRRKKRLTEEAKKCMTLESMFLAGQNNKMSEDLPCLIVETDSKDKTTEYANKEVEAEEIAVTEAVAEISDKASCNNASNIGGDGTENPFSEQHFKNEMFAPPDSNELYNFFAYHPQVPQQHQNVPFNVAKVFNRENNTPRLWLTYHSERKALFCSVCLAFCSPNESNVFMEGVSDWKHVYQRIKEHEGTNLHGKSSQAYIMFQNDKTVDKLLCVNQMNQHNTEVKQNRQVLDRIINVIKLIGKRGLSYR